MKILIVITFVLIVISGCTQASQVAVNTPEEVIETFIATIKANDYDAALALYPSEKVAKNADPFLHSRVKAPSEHEFYFNANNDLRKSEFAGQLFCFTGTFFVQYTEPDELATQAYPKKLSGIRLISIDYPRKRSYLVGSYHELFEMKAASYNAQEMTERIALIEYDGDTYLAGFTLIKYDDNWDLLSLSSALAEIDSFGSVTQITLEEYNEKILTPDEIDKESINE